MEGLLPPPACICSYQVANLQTKMLGMEMQNLKLVGELWVLGSVALGSRVD